MGLRSHFYGIAVMLPILTASSSSGAEDVPGANALAPDKSQYTLFDPTPDAQMRSFCTDRPTRSNLPCTVDAGHFQYETDAFNWTYSNHRGAVQDTYLYSNPTFKLGLTNRIDFEVNMAPFEEVKTRDVRTHAATDLTGTGDLFLRMKYSLMGNDGGDVAVTLLPYVKAPTAPPGIGNKEVEEGLIVPVSFNLPRNFVLLFDPEIDDLHNFSGGGYHANYQGLVNLSHTLFRDDVSGEIELWGETNRDPSGAATEASLDLAAQWLMRPDLQLDIGANTGLNRATPDFQGYVGISQRF
jgi:Putative MetA-pathway of phenol degradation